MDKTFGYYIFGGLLIGALFGSIWAGSDNPLMGTAIGAMAGAFISWFIAAAIWEQRKKEK